MGLCRYLAPGRRLNLVAVASGMVFLYVVLVGDYWWVSTGVGGKPTFMAGVAPYRIDIIVLERDVDVPAIPFIEASGLLTYLYISLGSILAGLFPGHRYIRRLIGYKAILAPLVTAISIYLGVLAAGNFFGLPIPYVGYSVVRLRFFAEGMAITTETPVYSGFTEAFYLVVVASVLALAGKLVMRCIEVDEEA